MKKKTAQPKVHCRFERMEDATKLKLHKLNPNDHPAEQIELYVKIVAATGFRRAAVVSRRSGMVTRGNGLVLAARSMGWRVPVETQDYADEREETADLLADNQLARLSDLNMEKVKTALDSVDWGKFDLKLTAFDSESLVKFGMLEATILPDAKPQIDRAADLQKQWGTKLGRVWKLGEHRLMCGDCTSHDGVIELLADVLVDLVVTDPPYSVGIGKKNVSLNTIGPSNRVTETMVNDADDVETTAEKIWGPALKEAFAVARNGCAIYMFAPQGGNQMMMMMMKAQWKDSMHQIIWKKNTPTFSMGRLDYSYVHEPIIYSWKGTNRTFNGVNQQSVIECDRPSRSSEHPTVKPVELISKLVANSSKLNAIVYDPFSGSGTTIIACDQLKRRCYAMEISPGYVAVALQRFADSTGQKPKLL